MSGQASLLSRCFIILEMMSAAGTDELEYLGIAIIGKKNAVNGLTRHCEMIH